MKTYALIIILLSAGMLFAQTRGTTQAELPIEDHIYCVQPRLPYLPEIPEPGKRPNLEREDWYNYHHLPLNTILRAGQQLGMQYVNHQQDAVLISSMGTLSSTARDAIDHSPLWLQPQLENVLSQLTPAKQTLWANLILTTQHPYIDEVAFCVAHSSPQYLNSDFALAEMFTENVQQIYYVSAQLSYVEIVDYGTPASDPDYWSTTRYFKKNAAGETEQVEVPRDIYYWYLVHPKITDEIPAYIDPAIIENNSTHNNNIAPPPTGKFWRTWLYNVQEETYPVLSDTLTQCTTLFNRDGSSGDALRALQWWVNNTMSFTSNAERPHQPVRIYRKHIGRCGEYADYASAVARIALIPCTSVMSLSTDHVWNEFWEDGWVQWEPVNGYIDVPMVYENGWGKVFGSVFEIRSDGFLTSVTDRYSDGLCTINIQVLDQNMVPVDGARVILAIFETTPRVDMVGFTDNFGLVSFPVGENRDYRARAECSFGIYPPIAGTYAQLVANSVDGETYNYQFVIAADKPLPVVETIPPPPDPVQDWRFGVAYQSDSYYLCGRVTWDDISSLGVYPKVYQEVDYPGNVSFLVMDADNYMFYTIDGFGSAFHYDPPLSEGTALFDIPTGMDYYAFLDTRHFVGNAVKIDGIMTFQYYGTAVDEDLIPGADLIAHRVFPNPSQGWCELQFELPKAGRTELAIYNLRGQKVKTLLSAELQPGKHQLHWNGLDDTGTVAASGIYFYRLAWEGRSAVGKLLKL